MSNLTRSIGATTVFAKAPAQAPATASLAGVWRLLSEVSTSGTFFVVGSDDDGCACPSGCNGGAGNADACAGTIVMVKLRTAARRAGVVGGAVLGCWCRWTGGPSDGEEANSLSTSSFQLTWRGIGAGMIYELLVPPYKISPILSEYVALELAPK